jgi:hypothetical protein
MSYPFSEATNLPTPIGGNLNGKYIAFDNLPESIKILLSNPKYVVVIRETTISGTPGGGRTTGTMWYNKQILGFTVEDAVRPKKKYAKTAIPDTVEDPNNFNGIPSSVYNIILDGKTNSDRIKKSLVDGLGMRVSSISDPTGIKIYNNDIYSPDFATDRGNLAFDGVFIHGGTSEGNSLGCIIFSRTRNLDGTLKDDNAAPQALNKYLKSLGLIGTASEGKLQQLAIVNLWELPEPQPIINTSGEVINNETNQSIQGVKVQVEESKSPTEPSLVTQTKSSSDGKIEIELTSSITTENSESLPKVIISAPGYESKEIIPYKGDGTAKTDLGVISLTPTKVALEQDKIKASQLNTDQIKELSKGDKNIDYFSQERLSNQINTIKSTLIPTVLTLISQFGITKATDLIVQNKDLDAINKSSCPSQLELTSIINKKNKLVKQLNNIYKVVDITTKTLGITTELISLLNQSNQAYGTALLAIPTSTGIPYVPGIPVGTITQLDDTKDNNKDKIQTLTQISTSVLAILVLLKQALLQAIQLLSLLDKLVQKCYPDANQEQLSIELIALTTQQSAQTSPLISEYNGFKLNVETEPTTNPLKRRRAIATNKQNVVMLQGEWSFSSIDQILIDELIFYIQQNNLKAD